MKKRKFTERPELHLSMATALELACTPKQRWEHICDSMPSGPVRYIGTPLYQGADVAVVVATSGPIHLLTNGILHEVLIGEIDVSSIRGFFNDHRPEAAAQLLICARFHETQERRLLAGNRLHWLDEAGKVLRTDRYQASFGMFQADDWGEYTYYEQMFDASRSKETAASLAEFTEQHLYRSNLAGYELNFDAILWMPANEGDNLPYFVSTSPDPLAWANSTENDALMRANIDKVMHRLNMALGRDVP